MRWSTVIYSLFCMVVVALHVARTFAGYTMPGEQSGSGSRAGVVSTGPHHK